MNINTNVDTSTNFNFSGTFAWVKHERQIYNQTVICPRQVDKLEFVQHVLQVSSEEGRNAELALYRRCPDEAEAILLQASPPLIYRAIKLNVMMTPRCASLVLP